MKIWFIKEIEYADLDNELNAFSGQGYEIYSINETSYRVFRVIVYKEKTKEEEIPDLPKVTVVPEKMAHLEKGAQLGKLKEPKKKKLEIMDILLDIHTGKYGYKDFNLAAEDILKVIIK